MSKVLIKLPKKRFIEELGKEIILGEFDKHILTNVNKQFSDKHGNITVEQLQGNKRFTANKHEYLVFNADWLD